MSFPDGIKEEALVKSRRCCCLCNEFAGLYTNVHHMIAENQGGPSTLDNAIVLCLRCHGEVGHYNYKHPIGDKYSVSELTRHRNDWWKWCESNPAVPLPKNPVSVSPSVIQFSDGPWLRKSILHVYNKEDRFYYQVWVKITVESEDVQFGDIGIELVRGHDDLKLHAGFVEMSASYYRMNCIDGAGRKATFLILGSLGPRATYSFAISQLALYKQSHHQLHCLRVALSSLSDEPLTAAEGSSQAYLTFVPPENTTVVGVSLLLRRT